MKGYERKTPEDLDCGLTVFAKVLGAKWKPCIVYVISQGYKRPSEIHKQLPTASPRVLDMQLRELEAFGMVAKQIHGGFPLRVEYCLTERGRSALPILAQMDSWGYANAEAVKDVLELPQDTAPYSCPDFLGVGAPALAAT